MAQLPGEGQNVWMIRGKRVSSRSRAPAPTLDDDAPDRVARFKGVLRCWDRCYALNGLPGQLDWEDVRVSGDTRIALIGLGLGKARERLTRSLEEELRRQHPAQR